jgi:hypothetical protein
VGRKTAERLVEEFGSGLFEVMHTEPGRLASVIRSDRVDQLLEGWKADLERRTLKGEGARAEKQGGSDASESSPPRRRARRGTRGRKRNGGSREKENGS